MSDKVEPSQAEREKALIEVFTVAADTAVQSAELFKSFEECLGQEWERTNASANISGSFTYPKWWVFDLAGSYYFHPPTYDNAVKFVRHHLFLTVCIDGRTLEAKRVERPVLVAGRVTWQKPQGEKGDTVDRTDGLSAWMKTNPPRAMDGKLREVRGFAKDPSRGPEWAMVLGVPLLEIAGPEAVRERLYQPLEELIADAIAERR